MDRVSKKLANSCTPEAAKIELSVIKTTDPITKREIYLAPDGYDGSSDDNVHKCDDAKPSITGICVDSSNNITIRVSKGTFDLQTLDVSVDGAGVASLNVSGSGTYSTNYNFTSNTASLSATVTDTGYYSDAKSQTYKRNGKDAAGSC